MPRNWRNFLRHSENKTELFEFLADKVVEHQTENKVIIKKGSKVISYQIKINLEDISPCNHEEADTRIFLNAKDLVKDGYKTVMIKANDTNVLVIAIVTFSHLQELGLEELWIAFGQGKNIKCMLVCELST